MTKHTKFEVKVGDLKYQFQTMKEICEFLGISYGSLYNLRSGRLKFKHYSKTHLEGVEITKIEFPKVHYKKKKEPIISKDEYHKKLEANYNSTISQEPAVQANSI